MTETFGHREKHMDQMNTSLVQREISSGTPTLITMKDEFTTAPSRKSFTQEYILKQRQGIGNDEKPYPCSSPIDLERHKKDHTDEGYFCLQCGNNYKHRYYLHHHQRIHTGERPYRCSHCGNRFREPGHLRQHVRVHTGEKPYDCLQCGKSFAHRGSLQIHQRIHTGEKPYQCSHCGNRFNDRRNLKRHQRIHTGEKPFFCSQCGKNFSYQSSLKSHKIIHERKK
ncbi:gastrula zinc finger protein XlCGF49.1-like [Tachysurus vachellii]|uniref:gastrula zinc finger protein XlCGF49.1-like n=1 Tax=Tachysurus vachellii TaxID=175792 RepID=UPI00296AD0F3|nr:gastrula zinc finger protein XlCGF49.1-like [Tachysurus vachellii]